MEVKFLKVTAPTAIDVIESCMNEGYEVLDKVRSDYEQRRSFTSNPSSVWSEWYKTWVDSTLLKLEAIYMSKHRAFTFREAKTNRYATSGDLPYTGIEHAIEAKINVLEGYYNFIMNRSQIVINYNGNINYQVGANRNEQF